MEIRKGMVKRWKGIDVRILDVDSDPAANVWVCEVADPDRDHMVPRNELHDAEDEHLHCDHDDGCCRETVGLACDETPRRLTESGFVACLIGILVNDEPSGAVFDPDAVKEALTFEEVGLLTSNRGLVVRMADGAEFQVTIVRSRRGRRDDGDEE